jgi:hypothetical protein
MKHLKLNLLCVFAILLALTSCSKGELNESEVVLETPVETNSLSARTPPGCNIEFANRLTYEITLINNRDQRRTFTIPNSLINIDGAFGSVAFSVSNPLRNSAFFGEGIRRYVFRSNRALQQDLLVTGNINNVTVEQRSGIAKSGERLNYARNISGREARPNNLDFIAIEFTRTPDRCVNSNSI